MGVASHRLVLATLALVAVSHCTPVDTRHTPGTGGVPGSGGGPGSGDDDTHPEGDTTDGLQGDVDTPLPTWPATASQPRTVIYQLVVRLFSNLNESRTPDGTIAENGVGKFNHINTAAIEAIKGLGVTHIWLTGVLRQATLTPYPSLGFDADDPDIVKGRAGSFYAIKDYYDVSPDYAVSPADRMAEFEALVTRIHDAGLKVLIDLVPNHVSRAYSSSVRPGTNFGASDNQALFFDAQNNFFYLVDPPGQSLQLSRPAHWNPPGVTFDGAFLPENGSSATTVPKVTGNDVTLPNPASTDWYETIKLNYGHNFVTGDTAYTPTPSTWTKMNDIIAYWQGKGVDGFRVDMAHMVPVEAWKYLITEATARDPNVLFMAEAYENLAGLLAAGFHSVYHDEPYDQARRLYQGTAGQNNLADAFAVLDNPERGSYVHYLENHDERRIASPVVTSGNPHDTGFGSPQAVKQLGPIFYLYSQGPLLVHNGQELGEPGAGASGFSLDDGRTTIFDYSSMPKVVAWANNHLYDGGGSSSHDLALRQYYADLLALSHTAPAMGNRYWGLEYFNNAANYGDASDALYSFARFHAGAGELLVVVANFEPGAASSGVIRLPADLLTEAGVSGEVTVRKVLDGDGRVSEDGFATTAAELTADGFSVQVGDQSAVVYWVSSP